MIRNEWEFLPGLNTLDPSTAADLFNLLHIRLIAPVIWLLAASSDSVRYGTMIGVEVFVVLHTIAHAVVRGAGRYQFQPPVETITVYGAAIASLVHPALLRCDSS